MTIGVMLTAYKRTHLLERQIESLHDQTVKPDKMMLLDNSEIADPLTYADHLWEHGVVRIAASKNLGVWPRFMVAPLLGTDYITVFDDDTIPGPRWFENCLRTLEELKRQGVENALLGSCGVAFVEGKRDQRVYLGWYLPARAAIQADIVGHAWFFPATLLSSFSPGPLAAEWPTCGEDYWLSYTAQQLGWPTVCPPHPENDKSWWGSVEGAQLGSDEHALWLQPKEEDAKSRFHDLLARIMVFDACCLENQAPCLSAWEMKHV